MTKVAVLGGVTGLSTLLSGLKKLPLKYQLSFQFVMMVVVLVDLGKSLILLLLEILGTF